MGAYRGDPVYNTIRLKGRFQTGDPAAEKEDDFTLTERPINGDAILYAEVPEEGEMSEIWNGLWIYIPDLEKEAELTGMDGCGMSALPAEIMAELYRTDDPYGPAVGPAVSATQWISSPSEDSMPEIVLESEVLE